jgi:hypothetical protein
MKIQWSALMVAGSGKLGGTVAARNRSGAYLRNKVTPINPNTSYQQNARGILGSLSTQWSQLTDGQRSSFNNAVSDFAKTDIFGDIRNPSGINLFVKLNTNLINTNQPQITTAPAKEEILFSGVLGVTADVSAQTLDIQLANEDNNLGKVLAVATPTLTAGTSFVKDRFRGIGFQVVQTDLIELGTNYVSKFGNFAIGANIHVGFKLISATGQASVMQTAKATVVA